jgi:hypothetical protein
MLSICCHVAWVYWYLVLIELFSPAGMMYMPSVTSARSGTTSKNSLFDSHSGNLETQEDKPFVLQRISLLQYRAFRVKRPQQRCSNCWLMACGVPVGFEFEMLQKFEPYIQPTGFLTVIVVQHYKLIGMRTNPNFIL